MTDYLGTIPVPEVVASGVFPLVSDYPHSRVHAPDVVVHQFGSGNAKITQRFLLGTGAKRFTVHRARLHRNDLLALRDFWEDHYGPYGAFTYNAPNNDGSGTTPYTCRFENEPLSWELLSDAVCSVGVTLVEIPTSSPTYPLNETLHRFPSAALSTALLSQVQQMIPLVKIQPLQPDYPAIFVSDRRCTVGEQLYLARLLDFDGISQSIGNESDEARFTFGNADRVMRELANDVDLFRASIEFSLYHVGTGVKLDLWKGDIVHWSLDSGPEFTVTAADGLYELNLPYPSRRISRTCWKDFDGPACPYSTQGSGGNPAFCDKGFDTPDGCASHGMAGYFGGVLAKPQAVRIKDNSTGAFGFGRSTITSVSLVADSIYDQVVPEIYTDSNFPVNCKLAAGREEGDFYNALGIVGEGPLGAFGSGHTLDNQPNHGPGALGLRTSLGNDPNPDPFSLGEGNPTVYGPERAAGTAFIELRRSDPQGLQLSRLAEHSMQAVVAQGLSGWVWTAPGARSWAVLTNPVWIVINMLLRARGLRFADAATCEQFFAVDAAVAAASICDEQVQKLVGSGSETQFRFRGILQEEKPLRDWMQEVLMNCLGFYSFAFGRLKLGVRVNSSSVEAFSVGNILFQSLQLAPLKPSFNHLTASFADEEFDYVANSVSVYDIDHSKHVGGPVSPLFLKSNMNLSGCSSKSQAARLVSVRLREELGGITPEEWKRARQISFRTTVLALSVEPGMVCSLTHPEMPGGSGEFRVTGWRLNKDYSIDIQGRTTTDSMYDLAIGPKPADVEVDPVPVEPIDILPALVEIPSVDQRFTDPDSNGDVAVEFTVNLNVPEDTGTLEAVDIYVDAPDSQGNPGNELGSFVLGTSPMKPPFKPIFAGRFPLGTVPRFQMDPPANEEPWRFYAVSRSAAVSRRLVAADHEGATPNFALVVKPYTWISGEDYAALVRNVRGILGPSENEPVEYKKTSQGQFWRYGIAWDLPASGRPFDGVDIVRRDADLSQHDEATLGRTESQFISSWKEVPHAPEAIRVLVVSWWANRRNPIHAGVTPHINFTVAPQEPVSNATDFTVADPEYRPDPDGIVKLAFDCTLTLPIEDEAWTRTVVLIATPGDQDPKTPAAVFDRGVGAQASYSFTIWIEPNAFPTSSEQWTFLAVSYDRMGEPASTPPSVTKSVHPVPRPSGTEYADNVTNAIAGAEYTLSIDGHELYKLSGSFTHAVADTRYKGCLIIARPAGTTGESDIELADAGRDGPALFSTEWFPLREPATFDIFFVSYDALNNVNSIDANTPKVTVEVEPQTTGKIRFTRADLTTIDSIDFEINTQTGLFSIKSLDFNKAFNYDATEFQITGGAFQMKGVDFGKAKAGTFSSEFQVLTGVLTMKSLAAEKIKTGVLEIGGAPVGQTRVSLAKFFTVEATPQLYAWIGDDSAGSGFVGAWFKRILIGGIAPWNAKIIADSNGNVAVPAGVITAGTLVAGVVYAGQINTGQVNAGQFFGHTLLLSVNGITTDISNQWDGNYGAYVGLAVKNSFNSRKTLVTNGGLACLNDNGTKAFEASGGSTGSLAVRDQWGIYKVEIFGHIGTVRAFEYQDASGYRLLGYRASAVANPSGGSVIDWECRAALITLLDRIRGHGLIF